MAEEYTAEDIAKLSDQQINEFKKYQNIKFEVTGNFGLYDTYDTYTKAFTNSHAYIKWITVGDEKQLKESPVSIELKRESEKWSSGWDACKFLSFLLFVGKTKAHISLDKIREYFGPKQIKIQQVKTRKNEAGETVIYEDAEEISTTGGHFRWDEGNIPYSIAASDSKTRPNCIKMIKLIHQTNEEIFAGFKFVIKLDSNEGNNAMNKKDDLAHSDLNEIVEEAIDKNKQVIFTGAPGTGKTYTVRKFVKEHTQDESQYKFVQFHPSYDYSDFVEGLRPVVTKDSPDPTFVRLDGTFKQFCRSIVEKELETFCSGFRDLSAPEKREKLKDYYNAVKEGTFQGGKTAYYFLIDEINRADLSKVFGELMFGLEESYRGIKNRFDTQYKNLKTYQVDPDTGIASPMAFDCFADGFFIPKNLYLIGTMNDIDRSVESFDFALRRRFRWIDVKANEIMESSLKAMGVPNPEDIARRAIKMNNCLSGFSFGLGEAYHIGPAYFKSMSAGEKLKEDLKEVFSHRIEPLLREYTRGQNAGKVEELIQKCEEKLLENKTQGGE